MIAEEVLRKVKRNGDCLEWQGRKINTGYGIVAITAHRLSYIVNKGPIPNGLWVLHSCDNRLCVNPEHLRLGTISDNLRDAHIKHPLWGKGERGGKARLSLADVREIRHRSQNGEKRKDLATKFKVKPCNISNIVANRIWRYPEAYP